MEINGKHYPMWGQFVEKQEQFIGGTLEDFGDSMDRAMNMSNDSMTTEIKEIKLRPNGLDSAFFEVIGEKFACGFDVRYGGIVPGEDGYITFSGWGGHSWRMKHNERGQAHHRAIALLNWLLDNDYIKLVLIKTGEDKKYFRNWKTPEDLLKEFNETEAGPYASQFTRELSELREENKKLTEIEDCNRRTWLNERQALREENERLKEGLKRIIDKHGKAQSTPDLYEVLKEIRNAEQLLQSKP